LNWADLLVAYRTVLLSEAGSGKTEEMCRAAQRLRLEGKRAFFLRLENIANNFDIAFEEGSSGEGSYQEFQKWLDSESEGWLLLDSVDEARLRNPGDFGLAIRRIGVLLRLAVQRTHIIISGRGTAWRSGTDLGLCQVHLPYREPAASEEERTSDGASGKNNPFKIVALDDLKEEQIKLFAKARGVAEIASFVNAIERADAWSMAARPDDLVELVEFWKKNGKIGNRLELMRSSIARRLKERDPNRDDTFPLSKADAIAGARSLAAAATLGRELAISVPDDAENVKGLAVSLVLPDWCGRKCAALLARPIFDEAIYSTVRFHHRSVQEYLTAEWFRGLLGVTGTFLALKCHESQNPNI
jgi:hypothetical protein